MGRTLKVKDANGRRVLLGVGKFRAIGYDLTMSTPEGTPVFRVVSRGGHAHDRYDWERPSGEIIATVRKGLVQKRTSLHVHEGRDAHAPWVVKCKSTQVLGGQFQVTTPEGVLLAAIKRELKHGVVTKQYFALTIGPGMDPYLAVMLALVANCATNERPRLFWGAVAVGALAII
jgi:uncharacterized protein YxjI